MTKEIAVYRLIKAVQFPQKRGSETNVGRACCVLGLTFNEAVGVAIKLGLNDGGDPVKFQRGFNTRNGRCAKAGEGA